MEGNKDEADRCIQIALRCIQSGEKEKARKFLDKAERLYPSKRAKELLARINGPSATNGSAAGPEESESSTSNHMPQASGAEGPRHRKSAAGAAEPENTTHTEKNYSSEQLQLVRKITKCKNYYDILGVAKDCGEDELKKAYRKLALKLHPDKNNAPGATEAFKAVGKAFGVLNDPEKRKRFDMYGHEENTPAPSRRNYRTNGGYHYEYDDDISAEEIFNMFFGGGFPQSHVRTRRNFHTHNANHFQHHQQSDSNYGFLLQLSPILFMILLSMLSSFLVSDPLFSLDRTHKYNTVRHTHNLQIMYYVKQDFASEYKGSIRRLEQQVEDEYIGNLRSSCFRERSYKENMMWRARNYGDSKLYEKATNLGVPSCDKLQKIYGG